MMVELCPKNQKPFTTEGTKDTEENQNLFTAKPLHGADAEETKEYRTLPLMNADDTDEGMRSGDG